MIIVVEVQITVLVFMMNAMVAPRYRRTAVIRVVTTRRGRGRITGHPARVPGRTGTQGGNRITRTAELIGRISHKITGTTGATLGPLEDRPMRAKVVDRVDLGTAHQGRGDMHPRLIRAHNLLVQIKDRTVHRHLQATGLGDR